MACKKDLKKDLLLLFLILTVAFGTLYLVTEEEKKQTDLGYLPLNTPQEMWLSHGSVIVDVQTTKISEGFYRLIVIKYNNFSMPKETMNITIILEKSDPIAVKVNLSQAIENTKKGNDRFFSEEKIVGWKIEKIN